jgi:hypothetical protein
MADAQGSIVISNHIWRSEASPPLARRRAPRQDSTHALAHANRSSRITPETMDPLALLPGKPVLMLETHLDRGFEKLSLLGCS